MSEITVSKNFAASENFHVSTNDALEYSAYVVSHINGPTFILSHKDFLELVDLLVAFNNRNDKPWESPDEIPF